MLAAQKFVVNSEQRWRLWEPGQEKGFRQAA